MTKKARFIEDDKDSLIAKRRLSHWKPGWRWLRKRIENHRERQTVKRILKKLRNEHD